jgi:hypothetical protein
MSDEVKGKDGSGAAVETGDPGLLANALRFERAKNKVLLDEVIALEDEVVNRCMADFDAVVSDETREFWREQLLTNRVMATAALTEMARYQVGSGSGVQGAAGKESTSAEAQVLGERVGRRPLHNRALARPVIPAVAGGSAAGGSDTDDRAAKIRNRAHEISRAERVPFSAAFRRAEKEMSGKS